VIPASFPLIPGVDADGLQHEPAEWSLLFFREDLLERFKRQWAYMLRATVEVLRNIDRPASIAE
jgi:hypothetical protein